MLNFGILLCTINIVTAGVLNLEDIGDPFRENLDWIFSKKDKSSQKEFNKFENKYTVCRTQECFQVAASFWESMNKSVDPCEDFYEYACGGWSINNPVPPTEMAWSLFNVMRKEVNSQIRDFLEEKVHKEDILPIKQIKKFYQSCMDVDALEKSGIKPLEAILSRNGGWPMAMEPQEWDPKEFTWHQIDTYYSRLIYTPAFYSIRDSVWRKSIDESDEEGVDESYIIIDPPELSPVVQMPNKMEFNRSKIYEDGSYAKLIAKVAIIFAEERGVSVDKKQIDADIEDMIKLEKKLYNRTAFSGDDSINGLMDELQTYYDKTIHRTNAAKINWKETLENIFAEANIELDGKELIVVPTANYLKVLSEILDTTKLRTIVNYIHWNFISRLLTYTNTKMNSLVYELNKMQTGLREQKPRWERCVENVDLKHAVSYQFVNKYFENKMEDEAKKIFKRIQNEMMKHILKSDWLDDKTRKIELEKLKTMKANIGYPKWYNNSTALINHYRGVVVGQQFLDNKISYIKFSNRRNLRMVKNPIESDDSWYAHPIVVNAFFNPMVNSLTLPAADFLPPFYSASRPETINYGILGMIIGHEVSHAFDDTGFYFDKDGDMVQLSKKIDEHYSNRSKCYSDQYVNFYSNSSTDTKFLEIKSMWALGENIADSLGTQMMFGALEDEKKEKNYPRLPGFEEFSNEQSFFLSFAKLWCINSTPEYEELKKKDEHSEGHYRVISAVQNSDGFAKAFKCPKNSPMNPEKKCKIW